MKTFRQFCEAIYDTDKPSDTPLEIGRVGKDRRKSDAERTKAKYKPRKDIGKQRPRSEREQQPTKERGTAALSPKEAQRKAYRERKARESGAKTKSADELLAKKKKQTTDPNYKPRKASGYTEKERKALYKKGEKKLRDLTLAATGKKKESELKHPITAKEVARRKKTSS